MIKTKDIKYYVKNLNVLYEDNHVIVIEKPADILSQGDKTGDFAITDVVNEYLKEKYNKPGEAYVGLVHRLDRRVSGVMVLAKTSKAASRLSDDIKNHNMIKYYCVKVEGEIKTKEEWNNVKLYIAKDEKTNTAYVSKKDGKESELLYKVLGYDNYKGKTYTYLYVNLITGRYNQIRLTFSNLGYPVLGDTKYGGSQNDELGLCCYKMKFIHPTKKEWMEFETRPIGKIWQNLPEIK